MDSNYEQLQSSNDINFGEPFSRFRKAAGAGSLKFNPTVSTKNRYLKYIVLLFLIVFISLIFLTVSKSSQLYNLQEESKALNFRLNQINEEESQLKQSLTQKTQEKQDLSTQNDNIIQSINELKKRTKQLSQEKDDGIQKVDDIKKRISKTDDEIDELSDLNKQANKKLRNIDENGGDEYSIEINKLRKKIKELESKISDIEDRDIGRKSNEDLGEIESSIITSSREISLLKKWLGQNYNMRLIYSTDKDIYSPSNFHKKVGRTRPTLSLIKMKDGKIIGGFTSQSWQGEGYKEDEDAFIFNLSNEKMYPVRDPSQAIYCSEDTAIVFGREDIAIKEHESISSFPMSYGKHGNDDFELTDGSPKIRMVALEVFALE
jgi:predicted  nucleic acid-binding Zn-ribbon protein